jgi:hypothetical protein
MEAMKRMLVGSAVLTLFAAPALAQDRVKTIQEADKVVVRKKTVVDFTDVTVDGELTRPEGSYVLNKKRTRFNSLIKVRDNFDPELQKSVDNL